MKILLLALISASAFLTGCARHISRPTPDASAFLQPTHIEGKYASMGELMQDPNSTTRDLVDFGGNADDANLRCNADKASALSLLQEKK